MQKLVDYASSLHHVLNFIFFEIFLRKKELNNKKKMQNLEMTPYDLYSPNIIVIYRVKEGYTVTCPVEEELFQKTSNIDFSSFDAVEKIQELNKQN